MTIAEKLTKVTENVPKVYKAGQKSEYDRFWDAYQQNGNRFGYMFGFAGDGWTAENFKPKYDIWITYGYMTFRKSIADIDMVEMCEKQGITIKYDTCSNFTQTFFDTKFTRIGEIDTSSASALDNTFNSATARVIDKIILKSDGSQTFSSTFANCTNLEEIRFEGTIGKSLDIHWSTELSAESIQSIIEHLGGSASATLTLPTTVESNYDAVYGSGAYATLVASRPSNWTIAYL